MQPPLLAPKTALSKTFHSRTGRVLCLLPVFFGAFPACADEIPSPFALTDQAWTSVKDIKIENPSVVVISPPPAAVETPPAIISNVSSGASLTPVAAYRVTGASATGNVEHGYQLQLDSNATTTANASLDTAISPPLKDDNWQAAAEAARKSAIASGETVDEQGIEHKPLPVRLSFLPDADVIPKETSVSAAHKRPKNMTAPPARPGATATSQVSQADLNAIAAYRKNQLAAIQGDHETLVNLQKAISTLGLNQQLGSLAGMNDQAHTNAANVVTSGYTQQKTP